MVDTNAHRPMPIQIPRKYPRNWLSQIMIFYFIYNNKYVAIINIFIVLLCREPSCQFRETRIKESTEQEVQTREE